MLIAERLSAKLKFRVILICFVVYAIITIVSFLSVISKHKENDERFKIETAMKTNLAEIRNVQNDLFNVYTISNDKEKEAVHIEQLDMLCSLVKTNIEDLNRTQPSNSRSMAQSSGIMKEEFDAYLKKLEEIKLTEKQIGELSGDGGRLEENRNAIRKTLSQFTPEGANDLFKDALKYEKDFLNEGDVESYKNFNKKIDAINQKTRKYASVQNPLIHYQIAKLADQISEYKITFNLIFSKRLLLGLDTYDGYKGEAQALVKTMQTDLEEIMIESASVRLERLNRSSTLGLVLQSIMIVVWLLLFFVLTRSINRPILELNNYVKKILRGELIKPEVPQESQNEIHKVSVLLGKLISNLREKLKVINAIGNGKSDVRIHPLSNDDEIANSLIEMKDNMKLQAELAKQRRKEEEVQDKIKGYLAEFGGILRSNNNNIDLLCVGIARNIIKYMKADYAAIYTYEDENPDDIHLYMRASYAADQQKFIKKRIDLYEGLIGTCAIEKQTFVIEDVPKDYVRIGSGFGFTNPGHLIIVPLLLNGKLFGLIEMCRTGKFEDYRIDFIERLAEDIAITISYVKENTRNIYKLNEANKRLSDLTNKIMEFRKTMSLQTSEIKELKSKNKILDEENSYLKDYKMAQQKRNN